VFQQVLCHGTQQDFEEFDIEFCERGGGMGRGFYFSNDLGLGRQYSGGLDPIVAVITMDNPYLLDRDAASYEAYLAWNRMFRPNADARERMIALGYDGVIFKQGGYLEAVVFHPEQISNYGRRPGLDGLDGALAL
jgi:hypothetical protein